MLGAEKKVLELSDFNANRENALAEGEIFASSWVEVQKPVASVMSKNVGKTSALGDTWELKKAKGFSNTIFWKKKVWKFQTVSASKNLTKILKETRN